MDFRGAMHYTRNREGTFHSHCYAAYKRARRICPVCDTPWNGDFKGTLKKVGEGAFVEGQDKYATARRRTDDDDKDEVVYYEGEDGEDVEAGGSTQPSQAKKEKGKAAAKREAGARGVSSQEEWVRQERGRE